MESFPKQMYDAVCAAIEAKLSTAILSVVAGKVPEPGFAVFAMPHIRDVCQPFGFTLSAFRVDKAALVFRFIQTKDLLSVAMVLTDKKKGKISLPVSDWTDVPNPVWYVRYEINGKTLEAGPFPDNEIDARFAYVRSLLGVARAAPIHRDLRVGDDWTPVALLGAPTPAQATQIKLQSGVTPQLTTASNIFED